MFTVLQQVALARTVAVVHVFGFFLALAATFRLVSVAQFGRKETSMEAVVRTACLSGVATFVPSHR